MFGSQTIEIVIGLAFVYLLFSLVCSALTEAVARLLRLRSGTLQKAIDNMLVGTTLRGKPTTKLEKFYKHPLILTLTTPSWYDWLLQRRYLCAPVGLLLIALAAVIFAAPVLSTTLPILRGLGDFAELALIPLWFGVLLLIASFFRYRLDGPSYIPSSTFAQVFMDKIRELTDQSSTSSSQSTTASAQTEGSAAAQASTPTPAAQVCAQFAQKAGQKAAAKPDTDAAELFQAELEAWYNNVMDRVNGWYARKARTIVFIFAVIVTLLLNIDTFAIAGELTRNVPLRVSVANAATQYVANNPAPDADPAATITALLSNTATLSNTAILSETAILSDTYASLAKLEGLMTKVDDLGVPIGWVIDSTQISATSPITPLLNLVATTIDANDDGYAQAQRTQRLWPRTSADWGKKSAGLALTMILLSMGAPFWFDLLSKLVNVRSAGNPPQGSQTEDGKAAK